MHEILATNNKQQSINLSISELSDGIKMEHDLDVSKYECLKSNKTILRMIIYTLYVDPKVILNQNDSLASVYS